MIAKDKEKKMKKSHPPIMCFFFPPRLLPLDVLKNYSLPFTQFLGNFIPPSPLEWAGRKLCIRKVGGFVWEIWKEINNSINHR